MIAGGRRLLALQDLLSDGVLAKQHTVRCMVIELGNAKELSLIENYVRKQMHPAQEYGLFAELFKTGENLKEIAERFGCDVKTVKQRLVLGQVHPEILTAYEKGDLDAEDIKAITQIGSADEQIKFKKYYFCIMLLLYFVFKCVSF